MTTEKFIETHMFKYDNTKTEYIGINQGCLEEALKAFAELKCKELLEIVAEKADIGMKKKSHYGKYRKWQNVKEDEVDLFNYEVQYFVDKNSILNAVNLKEFIK